MTEPKPTPNINPEILAFLDERYSQMIDSKLYMFQEKKKTPKKRDLQYHTIPEIKCLIDRQYLYLVDEFGSKSFSLSTLDHVLSKKTVMLENDLEMTCDKVTRWRSQLTNAIATWRENPPIIKAEKRGDYKMNKEYVQANNKSEVV